MPYLDKAPYDKNGNPHGEWLVHYSNCQLQYRWNFIHGVKHGFQEGYFSNGKKFYFGNLNKGKKVGYWYSNNKNKYYLWVI